MLLGILSTIRFYYKTIKKISNKLIEKLLRSFVCWFFGLDDPQKPTNQQTNKVMFCLFYIAKSGYFVITFHILV